MPCAVIDLTSLVAARAIDQDAFDPGYEDARALLNRPDPGSVNYVPLRWKQQVEDQPIFPLSYAKYAELWDRVLSVMGMRTHVRTYAMRVGTGARLDGLSRTRPHWMRAVRLMSFSRRLISKLAELHHVS